LFGGVACFTGRSQQPLTERHRLFEATTSLFLNIHVHENLTKMRPQHGRAYLRSRVGFINIGKAVADMRVSIH
jgi:hypothetical protein